MREVGEVGKWLGPILGLWIVACSTSSGASGGSADQACTDLANAVCQKLNDCTAVFVTNTYGDEATCAMRFKTSCDQTLAANGTGLTPALREDCAKAVPGASCEDLVDNGFPSACAAVAGQLAERDGVRGLVAVPEHLLQPRRRRYVRRVRRNAGECREQLPAQR